MRRLIKKPLAWMVLLECVVVAALVVVAWNVIGSAFRGGAAATAPPQTIGVTDDPSPIPSIPVPDHSTSQSLLPGLNLSPAFWRSELDQLNRDQVFLEQLEWRLVHGAMDTMQRYLVTVVAPAVKRAESPQPVGGSTSPSPGSS